MIGGARVLAVVPARSGSVGLPDKNLARLGGATLLERAAAVVRAISEVDRAIVSTDSQRYADHASKAGLDVPFLRPADLSGSEAAAVDVLEHALRETEEADGERYDLVAWVEPTSPLRVPEDVRACLLELGDDVDTVLTVSELDSKAHPDKLLSVVDGAVAFVTGQGASIRNRQELAGRFFYRNGLAYALRRSAALERRGFVTDRTRAIVTERPVANIDGPLDLAWAEFLLEREGSGPR